MNHSSYSKKSWSLYFATIAVVTVAMLNWKHGYPMEDLLFNSVIAFGIMYALVEVNLYLLEKYGVWTSLDDDNTDKSVDFLVSDPENELKLAYNLTQGTQVSQEQENITQGMSGQLEPSLPLGLPDDDVRAEIKEKMGLN